MIVPISINTQDIYSQFDISNEDMGKILDNIAKSLGVSYVAKLEAEASKALHSTRQAYLENIRLIDSGRLSSTILLDYSKNKLVQMIEEGAAPFDMKEKMLQSSKAKTSKTGKKYMSIPFRWAAPTSLGESSLFSGKLPAEVHAVAKKKEVNSIGKVPGLTISEIPKEFQSVNTRKEIQDSQGKVLFGEYSSKSSIYEGVAKRTDTTTAQSTYMSFRRVSENSDKNSWIHPGVTAMKLMDKAYQKMNIDDEVSTQIDVELSKLGF